MLVEAVVVTLGFHGRELGLESLGRRYEGEIRGQVRGGAPTPGLSLLSSVTIHNSD